MTNQEKAKKTVKTIVLEQLEMLKKWVEEGKVILIAGAFVQEDGSTGKFINGGKACLPHLVGELETLKVMILETHLEEERKHLTSVEVEDD